MKTREELIECMAVADHAKWRDLWISQGEDTASIPTWADLPDATKTDARQRMEAILTAIEAAGAVVVSKVATGEMIDAGRTAPRVYDSRETVWLLNITAPYTAMLAASPYR